MVFEKGDLLGEPVGIGDVIGVHARDVFVRLPQNMLEADIERRRQALIAIEPENLHIG